MRVEVSIFRTPNGIFHSTLHSDIYHRTSVLSWYLYYRICIPVGPGEGVGGPRTQTRVVRVLYVSPAVDGLATSVLFISVLFPYHDNKLDVRLLHDREN